MKIDKRIAICWVWRRYIIVEWLYFKKSRIIGKFGIYTFNANIRFLKEFYSTRCSVMACLLIINCLFLLHHTIVVIENLDPLMTLFLQFLRGANLGTKWPHSLPKPLLRYSLSTILTTFCFFQKRTLDIKRDFGFPVSFDLKNVDLAGILGIGNWKKGRKLPIGGPTSKWFSDKFRLIHIGSSEISGRCPCHSLSRDLTNKTLGSGARRTARFLKTRLFYDHVAPFKVDLYPDFSLISKIT